MIKIPSFVIDTNYGRFFSNFRNGCLYYPTIVSEWKMYSLKNHTSVWKYITYAGKGLRLLKHAVSLSLEQIVSFWNSSACSSNNSFYKVKCIFETGDNWKPAWGVDICECVWDCLFMSEFTKSTYSQTIKTQTAPVHWCCVRLALLCLRQMFTLLTLLWLISFMY